MAQKADNDSSLSLGDSSSSSKSSKSVRIDEFEMRAGTDKISLVYIERVFFYIIPYLLPQISKCIELVVVMRNIGIDALGPYLFFSSICELLSQNVTFSLAQGANVFVQRELSKNQIVAANIYFAHFFVIALIWAIIALIMYLGFIKNVFRNDFTGTYIIFKGEVAVFLNVFAYAITPFLESESRIFVMVMKEFIEFLLFVSLLIAQYNEAELSTNTLSAVGISFFICTLINFVWMVFVIFKIPFFDVEYKAVLKFQTKKLSPIRPRIIGQMLYQSIPYLVQNAGDNLLLFFAINGCRTRTEYGLLETLQYMRVACFSRVRGFMLAFEYGFRDTFEQISQYNISIKKQSRVFEAHKAYTIYFYVIVFPIYIVIICCSFGVPSLLFDKAAFPNQQLYSYLISDCKESALEGAWCMFLPQFYYVGMAFITIENLNALEIIFSILSIACAAVLLICSIIFYGDNAPMTLALALAEVINASVGLSIGLFYSIKYNHHYEAAQKAEPVSDERIKEQNAEIRESVMAYLAKTDDEVERDEEEMLKKSSKNMAVFNKSMALRSSRQFQSLRESIGADNVSSSKDNNSIVRTSQINISIGEQK